MEIKNPRRHFFQGGGCGYQFPWSKKALQVCKRRKNGIFQFLCALIQYNKKLHFDCCPFQSPIADISTTHQNADREGHFVGKCISNGLKNCDNICKMFQETVGHFAASPQQSYFSPIKLFISRFGVFNSSQCSPARASPTLSEKLATLALQGGGLCIYKVLTMRWWIGLPLLHPRAQWM